MARYVDGFVIPIPKKNVAAYRKMAAKAGKVWMEYGALEFVECIGDDLAPGFGFPFPRLAKAKADETVLFSFIIYKSKRDRDRINKAVMKDPRISPPPKEKTFDSKKMTWGGFKAIVDLS